MSKYTVRFENVNGFEDVEEVEAASAARAEEIVAVENETVYVHTIDIVRQ
jgi:hypothetical protein